MPANMDIKKMLALIASPRGTPTESFKMIAETSESFHNRCAIAKPINTFGRNISSLKMNVTAMLDGLNKFRHQT